MRRVRLRSILDRLLDHLKGFVLALIATVSVLGIIVGYKYYRHTQEDPEFCLSCHMMQEAFNEWQRGKHRDVVCQKCHRLNILEQNQLLVAFVANKPVPLSRPHGREKPWAECRKCHSGDITQGSRNLRQSYGHAKHVFMLGAECKACHASGLHNFQPDENACGTCHMDKGVHGVGMEAFSCLKCHTFGEKTPTMVSKDKCVRCHHLPMKGPMAEFPCHQCHKPHGKIKLTSEDCLGRCHSNEGKVGQHARHMKKGMACLDCHRAHNWVVGQREARGLCGRCHPPKDPKTFVY